jgi:hypothetical protein
MFYGLAGFYLIEDDLEQALELPSGDFDVPLMIQDRAFNPDGSLKYSENVDEGFMGTRSWSTAPCHRGWPSSGHSTGSGS